MATAGDLINASLREIGVLASGETAEASDSQDALVRLNRLLNRLEADRLWIYQTTRTTWTIVASTGSYTVGSGGAVNIARPVFVENVRFEETANSPATELPLVCLSDDDYERIRLKTQTSTYPTSYYYEPTYPLGTLTFWPVPTSSTLLGVMYHGTAATQLAALTTAISLPPGYEEMLVTNLALLLCPSYSRTPHPVLVAAARESLAAVKRANIRRDEMESEMALSFQGRQGTYDIWRD